VRIFNGQVKEIFVSNFIATAELVKGIASGIGGTSTSPVDTGLAISN